jgi:hypothetical protein
LKSITFCFRISEHIDHHLKRNIRALSLGIILQHGGGQEAKQTFSSPYGTSMFPNLNMSTELEANKEAGMVKSIAIHQMARVKIQTWQLHGLGKFVSSFLL